MHTLVYFCRMSKFKHYMSMVKFSHTIFAMPFAMIGYFMAISRPEYSFEWQTFALVIGCMIFARNAAMAFNRYIDRHIDKANPRTAAQREIPNGTIAPKKALAFVILNCLAFLACTWFINLLCFYIAPFALLIVLGYSFTKRFTALCHFILGLGLAIAPLAAWLAVTASFELTPILFSLVVLLWVSGFDIIYALQDESFDKDQKLHSIPVLLGKKGALWFSSFLHLICISLVIWAGVSGEFGNLYWAGAGIFSLLLIYQHTLVTPNNLSKVNLAFFTTNGLGSVLFGIFVITDLYI
jgi:4-hydroxybenzoate polyprenyltransferase